MTPRFDIRLIPPEPDLSFEKALWAEGLGRVAGIDEAGRGPLAGPVYAAAVILPPDPEVARRLHGVRDSKQMTARQRQTWAIAIRQTALDWGVGAASVEEIDRLGILPATVLAATRAVHSLNTPPDSLLTDYLQLPELTCRQTALVKGDARCLSIASASILAKTARDALLCELDSLYPGYGFARHKGYGTPDHLEALKRLGPCPIHRKSFRPIRGSQPVEE